MAFTGVISQSSNIVQINNRIATHLGCLVQTNQHANEANPNAEMSKISKVVAPPARSKNNRMLLANTKNPATSTPAFAARSAFHGSSKASSGFQA